MSKGYFQQRIAYAANDRKELEEIKQELIDPKNKIKTPEYNTLLASVQSKLKNIPSPPRNNNRGGGKRMSKHRTKRRHSSKTRRRRVA
jgi:hypothetical protein